MKLPRRSFLKNLATISTSAPLISCGTENAPSQGKPNILFILTDDQRFDMLGVNSDIGIKTPYIDSLARAGANFRNAFVTTPICAASRASILTGLHERTHGFTFRKPPLENKFIDYSYLKLLKDNDYRVGYVGKLGVRASSYMRETCFTEYYPVERKPYYHKMPDGKKLHETLAVGEYAKSFIKRAAEEQAPFNLNLSFNAPHAADSKKVERPFPPPSEFEGLYDEVDVPAPKFVDDDFFNALPDFLKRSLNVIRHEWRWGSREEYNRNFRDYLSMITGVDSVVGDVLKTLDEVGQRENTIVIFTSDNGFYLGNRGFAGKWSHFEEASRVPLLISDPRLLKGGGSLTEFALNVDICPTILDYANIPGDVRRDRSGRSLRRLVEGSRKKEESWRNDFLQEHLMDSESIPKWEGVRSNEYQYVRYFEQEPDFEFLYDLKNDPEQLYNLSDNVDYETQLIQMRERCNQLANKVGSL